MNVRILESIGRRERELSEHLLRAAYRSLQETHRFEVGQQIHARGLLHCRDRCLEESPPLRNGIYYVVPHIRSRQIICCFRCHRAEDGVPGRAAPEGFPDGMIPGDPDGKDAPEGVSARWEVGMTWEEYLTGRIRPVSCPPEDTGPVLTELSQEMLSSLARWQEEYETEWALRGKRLP